jgi:toxin-antitoxin system PIN domain toxin
MVSFDTNLVVYAANSDAPECEPARAFLASLQARRDVAVCELMLVEVYLKIRNSRILTRPFGATEAAGFCQAFRRNRNWLLVEQAPVMGEVWRLASRPDFALRRIIDARLALTLRHHGVSEFATANEKDFAGFGFKRVWNPLNP